MELDVDAAHARRRPGRASRSASSSQAARGAIVDLVNEAMLGALRVVTVQRGPARRTTSRWSRSAARAACTPTRWPQLLGCYPVIVPQRVRRAVGAGLRRLRRAQRVQPDVHPRGRRTSTPAELRERLRDAARRRRSTGWRREGVADRRPRHRLRWPTCAITARDSRSRSRSTRQSSTRSTLDGSPSAFADAHQRLYGFDLEGGAELVSPARAGHRSRPGARDARTSAAAASRPVRGRDAARRRVWTARGPVDVADLRPRAPGAPAWRSRATRSSSSTTRRPWSFPGHVAAVDPHAQPADHRRRSADDHPGRSRHARPDRERAAERALRDGRGRAPRGHVADDPRPARRVPDDLRRAAAGWSSASSAPTSPASSSTSAATSARGRRRRCSTTPTCARARSRTTTTGA